MYLRKIRQEAGKSSRDVGEALGVAHSTVLRWEQEGRVPQKRREALADVLGVNPTDIPSAKERSQYVTSAQEVLVWMSSVMVSDLPFDVRATLIAIATQWDTDLKATSVTQETISDEMQVGEDRVSAAWDDVLSSEWLERRGTAKWTFKLRFPNGD